MSSRKQMKWRVAGVVAALLVLVGCSALPTAPIPFAKAPASGTGLTEQAPYDPPATDSLGQTLPGLPILDPIGTVVDTLGIGQIVPVVGDQGGVVTMWGMTLRIPAKAIGGNATLTVTMVNPDKHECSFEIDPSSLNHFSEPVTLEFDVPEATDMRGMSIYWWDPVNSVWTPVPSSVDPDKKTISTQLQHFSKYKVDSELMGKAGW